MRQAFRKVQCAEGKFQGLWGAPKGTMEQDGPKGGLPGRGGGKGTSPSTGPLPSIGIGHRRLPIGYGGKAIREPVPSQKGNIYMPIGTTVFFLTFQTSVILVHK